MSSSQRVEDCLVASAWLKPESVVTNTREIYRVVNEAAPYGFMNGIYRTSFAADTSAAELRVHYDFYRERRIAFRWYAFPHSRPTELETLLSSWGPASVTELQGLSLGTQADLGMPEDVAVEAVDANNLGDYIDACVAGWQQSGEEAQKVRRDIERDFSGGQATYSSFLARYRGQPASTGCLRVVGNAGYLFGGSTDPRFRGHGVYKGLVAQRLQVLRDAGVPTAIVLARKQSSAPICLRLGFQPTCEVRCFEFAF